MRLLDKSVSNLIIFLYITRFLKASQMPKDPCYACSLWHWVISTTTPRVTLRKTFYS